MHGRRVCNLVARGRLLGCAVLHVWIAGVCSTLALAQALPPRRLPPLPLLEQVQARVAACPQDGAAWRMLGRLLEQQDDMDGALRAYERAVLLAPDSAAAQFDLARVLSGAGAGGRAVACWQRVVELAPASDYGIEAAQKLEKMGVVPVSFEASWVEQPLIEAPRGEPAARRLGILVKTGVLYNSNVEMTPISRGIPPLADGSFQAFVTPEFELRVGSWERWNSGVLFAGDFYFNEGHLARFNLQHYQPGLFLQRPFEWAGRICVPRVEYHFAYDAFDGRSFGLRHALDTALEIESASGNVWLTFWTLDWTDFEDDGELPSITSMDGWTHTLGTRYMFWTGGSFLHSARVGMNVQLADLEGASFAYAGFLGFVETESPFLFGSVLRPRLGWGCRDYFDYPFSPSRNESLWHASIEIRKALSRHLSLTTRAVFDRFDSRDEAFDADRFTAGSYLVFER